MLMLISFLLTLVCVGIFYMSWQSQSSRLFILACVVLIASNVCWSFWLGWELGLVFSVSVIPILVWPLIAREQKSVGNVETIPRRTLPPLKWGQAITHTGHWLVVMLVHMLLATIVTVCLCFWLPIEETNQLALGIVLLPLVWAAMSYFYLTSKTYWQTLILQAFVALLALMSLWLRGII